MAVRWGLVPRSLEAARVAEFLREPVSSSVPGAVFLWFVALYFGAIPVVLCDVSLAAMEHR